MSGRIGAGEAAAPGGIFDRTGSFVVRRPVLVIVSWIVLAVALALIFPPLPVQTGKRTQKPLPDDAPTVVINQQMDKAFSVVPGGDKGADKGNQADKGDKGDKADKGDKGGGSLLMIILTDEKGISPADEDVYRKLVDRLHEDTQDKMSVQDFISAPPMREVLASKDGKAFNLPISFPGDGGAPATLVAFHRVTEIAKQTTAGTTLTANVSGPVATIADATDLGFEDLHYIEIGTIVAVLLILFVIYRNVVTMFVPLLTIGASIGTSQGVLSGLAEVGLPVNMQTIVFMSAVMIGAGVDYAVFLISRYHDYLKIGQTSDQAVKSALMSIGKVIGASAATVAVT
ncbi:MAG: MMPL family transporter, partial [Mycobacterium sp.]